MSRKVMIALACMVAAAPVLFLGAALAVFFVLKGMTGKPQQQVAKVMQADEKQPPNDKPDNQPKLPPQPVIAANEYQFGEEVRHGDLLITVVEVLNEGPFAGQFNGKFTQINTTIVHVRINNLSDGKIAEWSGWQGKGEIKDEHDNIFKPISLRGWAALPHNNTLGGGWDGDFQTRIFPKKVYDNGIYYQSIPATSKQATVILPLGERTIRYKGLLGSKDKLDHAKALANKQGQVLEATKLVKDVAAGSKTLKEDYPQGCTVRVTGKIRGWVSYRGTAKSGYVVTTKWVRETRSDLAKGIGQYDIWLKCEDGSEAICTFNDKKLYDRLVSKGITDQRSPTLPPMNPQGDTITMQGRLDRYSTGKTIQLQIANATEQ